MTSANDMNKNFICTSLEYGNIVFCNMKDEQSLEVENV